MSNAEAEFYVMIEDVIRDEGLRSLAVEVAFVNLENGVHIGTLELTAVQPRALRAGRVWGR